MGTSRCSGAGLKSRFQAVTAGKSSTTAKCATMKKSQTREPGRRAPSTATNGQTSSTADASHAWSAAPSGSQPSSSLAKKVSAQTVRTNAAQTQAPSSVVLRSVIRAASTAGTLDKIATLATSLRAPSICRYDTAGILRQTAT